MITEQVKAIAKARIKQSIPLEDIAQELEIPLRLVEEWANKQDTKDLIVQEATLLAVDKIVNASKVDLVPLMEDKLKETLEETAIDITQMMAVPARNGDVVHAKTLHLLSDSVIKLYQTIILKGVGTKGAGGSNLSNDTLDAFSEMMRD